jgi:hypothetical protein
MIQREPIRKYFGCLIPEARATVASLPPMAIVAAHADEDLHDLVASMAPFGFAVLGQLDGLGEDWG